jgi:hypothetical protein
MFNIGCSNIGISASAGEGGKLNGRGRIVGGDEAALRIRGGDGVAGVSESEISSMAIHWDDMGFSG